MQLINAPGKLVLPFANAGAKNPIPVASQIGIVAGAASLTDGFPPLTRTPLAAGGVPPSGLDMNGIIYELSAILRWANAGAGYVYDGTFATDSNVGGYPKGARVLRSDGLGYWFNTTDNNTTDPEDAGAVAAGWVPDFTNGVAAVTMTGSNVTLTALQYGKPIVVISGLLTANLNLIFPSIAGQWAVINNTTGAYSVTCKTAAGTGVVVNSAQAIVGDGTNIYSAVNDAISLLGENVAHAAGTADALTAAFTPAPHAWPDGVPFFVRAASANATTTPTFTPNSGTLTAKTIVKGANGALAAGDIAGAGHWLVLQYDSTLDKVVLLNPATGINIQTSTNANFIINGGFDIWQRGTSGGAINSYLADRWKTNSATTTARSTDVPAGSLYSLAMTGTAGNVPAVETPLELKGTGSLAPFKTNTDYTVSFKVKASVGSNIAIRARFADGAWGANVIDVLPLTNINVATGSWQTVSYTFNSGATVPNGTNKCLALMVSAGAAASTANVAQVKLEESSKATPFNFQQIADVLAQCHRYYISGFAPRARNPATSTATVLGGVSFPTVMRAAPTVTMTPAGSGLDTSAGAFGFSTQESVAGSSTGTSFAYTADAEL